MTVEADHGGNMLTIDSRGFISRMCVCCLVFASLHVSRKAFLAGQGRQQKDDSVKYCHEHLLGVFYPRNFAYIFFIAASFYR